MCPWCFSPFLVVFDLCPVQEVSDPALCRRGDHTREQREPDLRPTWDDRGQPDRWNVSDCRSCRNSQQPTNFTQVGGSTQQRLQHLCSASHPREQSVSYVTVCTVYSTIFSLCFYPSVCHTLHTTFLYPAYGVAQEHLDSSVDDEWHWNFKG